MMLLVCLLLIFPCILIILDALQCKRPVEEAMDDLVGLFPQNDVDLMLRVVKHVNRMDSGKTLGSSSDNSSDNDESSKSGSENEVY